MQAPVMRSALVRARAASEVLLGLKPTSQRTWEPPPCGESLAGRPTLRIPGLRRFRRAEPAPTFSLVSLDLAVKKPPFRGTVAGPT